MCPIFALVCLQAFLQGSIPFSSPIVLGPHKRPDCRSLPPAAGWCCGSSYPGWRRQTGGGAAAEPGLARGPAAPAERALSSSPLSLTSVLLRVKARSRLRPSPNPSPPLPPSLRLWRSLAFRPARPKWGHRQGTGQDAETAGAGWPSLFSLSRPQTSLDLKDKTELPQAPP